MIDHDFGFLANGVFMGFDVLTQTHLGAAGVKLGIVGGGFGEVVEGVEGGIAL
jgi:hypothetical protein